MELEPPRVVLYAQPGAVHTSVSLHHGDFVYCPFLLVRFNPAKRGFLFIIAALDVNLFSFQSHYSIFNRSFDSLIGLMLQMMT